MNIYGTFVDPIDIDEARARLLAERYERESSGPYEPSVEEAADLEKAVIRRNENFAPDFPDDLPATLIAVWRLPKSDQYFRAGTYEDMPRSWPRCIARAEFNGYWEDLYLTEDGQWLHRDDPRFGQWLPNIGYELQQWDAADNTVGLMYYTGVLDAVPIDSHPAREACLRHGIDGTGFGTDPKTGWQGIRQHPLGPDSPNLPWRFRV